MSKKNLITLGIVCVGLALATAPLSAQEVKASGTNMFVNKVNESFSLADGSTASRVSSTGFIASDDPSNPLRLASMTCTGTSITAKDGKPVRGAGTCDSVDGQGDVAFYWWRTDEKNGGRWGFLGGTGKWANVEGGGTYEPTFQWKDGRTGNNWKGTWKTK
ncbi:MAG: hypothetical protein WCC53_12975 [Thermoanaerobaculia bacterium]|jgi:hypothetical protein